ncbi:hypothetical protein CPI83_29200 (plasmid) [Rhodococcus sp. H-CA8f]|nr:hypothetical protein CPI83_29200 [Rhodococcus sp. H-CA8f]
MTGRHRPRAIVIAAVSTLLTITVMTSACSRTPEPSPHDDGAHMSSSQPTSGSVNLTALRAPRVLDAALPPAFRGLHANVVDEDDSARYFTVLYTPTEQSTEVRASIQVTALDRPVSGDDAEAEAQLYGPPVYQQAPVPEQYRDRYGQHSFVTTSHDLDTVKWSLTSDSLYISVSFPENTVPEAELWNLADEILRLSTSST